MTARPLALAAALLALAGCGATSADLLGAPPGRPPLTDRDALNARAAAEPAVVRLADGFRYPAVGLVVGPDTSRWRDAVAGYAVAAPTADVRTVTFTSRLGIGATAVTGLMPGVAVGLGGALLFADGTDRGFGPPPEVAAGVSGALLGLVGGALVAAGRPVETVYVVTPGPSRTSPRWRR